MEIPKPAPLTPEERAQLDENRRAYDERLRDMHNKPAEATENTEVRAQGAATVRIAARVAHEYN